MVAKYLGAHIVVILSILPTYLPLSISALDVLGNLDWGAAFGSFIGLVALGAAYTAVALFAVHLPPIMLAFVIEWHWTWVCIGV